MGDAAPSTGSNSVNDIRRRLLSLGALTSAAVAAVATPYRRANAGASPHVHPGTIIMWASEAPPTGYLECNGAAISRTQYHSLFQAIGVIWGAGDGSTTFNIPDFRGVFARGWDDGRGVDVGREFGSAQADNFAAHTHAAQVNDPGHSHTIPVNPTSYVCSGSGDHFADDNSNSTGAALTGITVTNGMTGGVETVPKNIAVMFCIRT